jgi:hypothetical protein
MDNSSLLELFYGLHVEWAPSVVHVLEYHQRLYVTICSVYIS